MILPTAPDPTRLGFGQAYAGVNLTTQSTSARLLHDFSPNWDAMAGGLAQRLDRFIDTPVNNITDNTGNYSTSLATGFAPRFGVESDFAIAAPAIRALPFVRSFRLLKFFLSGPMLALSSALNSVGPMENL